MKSVCLYASNVYFCPNLKGKHYLEYHLQKLRLLLYFSNFIESPPISSKSVINKNIENRKDYAHIYINFKIYKVYKKDFSRVYVIFVQVNLVCNQITFTAIWYTRLQCTLQYASDRKKINCKLVSKRKRYSKSVFCQLVQWIVMLL